MSAPVELEEGLQPKRHSAPGSGSNNVVDVGQSANLNPAQDAYDVISPGTINDPNNPLNWSDSKKMTILLIVSMTAFLPDFGSSVGAVTSVVQSNLL